MNNARRRGYFEGLVAGVARARKRTTSQFATVVAAEFQVAPRIYLDGEAP
jgi:hypothetical protein